MRPTPRGWALLVMLLMALGGLAGYATGDWFWGRPAPCVYEDGSGGPLPCYWDGDTRGNRTGRSFIVHEDETITYLP